MPSITTLRNSTQPNYVKYTHTYIRKKIKNKTKGGKTASKMLFAKIMDPSNVENLRTW